METSGYPSKDQDLTKGYYGERTKTVSSSLLIRGEGVRGLGLPFLPPRKLTSELCYSCSPGEEVGREQRGVRAGDLGLWNRTFGMGK